MATDCTRCGAHLFTDGYRVTDTWDSSFCVSGPGRFAGLLHTTDPKAAPLPARNKEES